MPRRLALDAADQTESLCDSEWASLYHCYRLLNLV